MSHKVIATAALLSVILPLPITATAAATTSEVARTAPPSASSTTARLPGTPGRLVYAKKTTRGTDIFTSAADGTNVKRLTWNGHESNPAWSPTGWRILFQRSTPGYRNDIWVMNSNGGHKRLVVGGDRDDRQPSWAPGGQRIVFTRGRHLAILSFGTGEVTALTTPSRTPYGSNRESQPAWSRDGTRIVFVRGTDQPTYNALYTIRPDGTHLSFLGRVRNGGVAEPAWAPGGHRVVFSTWQFGPREDVVCSPGLGIVNADGTNLRFIARDGTNVCSESPSWSPSGTEIVFYDSGPRAADETYPEAGVWRITPTGNRVGTPILGARSPDERALP
jgi:Tol biopolymer transport system component